jgi:hypothetical protein
MLPVGNESARGSFKVFLGRNEAVNAMKPGPFVGVRSKSQHSLLRLVTVHLSVSASGVVPAVVIIILLLLQ